MSEQSIPIRDQEQDAVEYRIINNFSNYRIGSDGSVWKFCRGSMTKASKPPRWKRLNPAVNSCGYRRVSLVRDGRKYERPVHRLVLEAFVGPRPPGHQCCHGDGDKMNNSLRNLRWATQEDNCADKELHGRLPFGSLVMTAKLSERDVELILRLLEAGVAQFRIAYAFLVSDGTVSAIAARKSWKRLDNISREGVQRAIHGN